jgi:hypothetical protein
LSYSQSEYPVQHITNSCTHVIIRLSDELVDGVVSRLEGPIDMTSRVGPHFDEAPIDALVFQHNTGLQLQLDRVYDCLQRSVPASSQHLHAYLNFTLDANSTTSNTSDDSDCPPSPLRWRVSVLSLSLTCARPHGCARGSRPSILPDQRQLRATTTPPIPTSRQKLSPSGS